MPTQDNYMLLSPKAMLVGPTPQGMAGFQLLGTSALSGPVATVPGDPDYKPQQRAGQSSKAMNRRNQAEPGRKDAQKSAFAPGLEEFEKLEKTMEALTKPATRERPGLRVHTRGPHDPADI